MQRISIFYDSSCFPTIPGNDAEFIINENENFITTSVFTEVKAGQLNNPSAKEFEIIVDKNGKLSKHFNLVSLDDCDKDPGYSFESQMLMYLKKNPLLCSAYYTWISSAVNPAIIHDTYRHMFNEILFSYEKQLEDESQLSRLESHLRVKETQDLETNDKLLGRNLIVTRPWLLKTRRKRFDEFKKGNLVLTDYQTLTTALLYSCKHGKNVQVLTADRDLVDIKDNLYRSAIERYGIYTFLKQNIVQISDENFQIRISLKQLYDIIDNVLKQIEDAKQAIYMNVMLYRNDCNKVFQYPMKIPLWLRDFILEYKKNLNCLSLNSIYETKYNIKFFMDPDFKSQTVKYTVGFRPDFPYKQCLHNCHSFCKYPKIEKNSPNSLSDFFNPH